VHPAVEKSASEEKTKKLELEPEPGEAYFICDESLAVGTSFALTENNRQFKITRVLLQQHTAREEANLN